MLRVLLLLGPFLLVAVSPDSPLPPCPSSPNCVRTARTVDATPDTAFAAAQRALDALGPAVLETTPTSHRAHAVYRVALVFKDDVDLVVAPADAGSTVHVRSASRTGYSDLGVNRRRVDRFFQTLEQEL